jgi:hypothetical protein
MIYEVEIDDSNDIGKKALAFLKGLNIPTHQVPQLLPEQKILIELSLKDIDEGNLFTHDEAMKNAEEWLNRK